jgi:hypothetical protein
VSRAQLSASISGILTIVSGRAAASLGIRGDHGAAVFGDRSASLACPNGVLHYLHIEAGSLRRSIASPKLRECAVLIGAVIAPSYDSVAPARSSQPASIANGLRSLCRSDYVDDQALAQRGKRRLHMFHPSSVTEIEETSDLRQMPSQSACRLCGTDALLARHVIQCSLRHPERNARASSSPALAWMMQAAVP